MAKVAVVGLGEMGSRIAQRLLRAGHELTLWNRTRAKAEELGAPVASSPAAPASRAEVVITMVADPAAKLVANSTLIGVIGILGEAIALGDALGLSREATFDVLGTTALAEQAERRRPALESGDYAPRFPLRLARKDADLIAELVLDL